jgi:membrane protein implicated in regulation of membrane protease activity
METAPKPRHRAWIPALIGLGLIVGGFVVTGTVDFLFMGQDPAGKAMAAGFAFIAFGLAGLVFLIIAAVVAIRNRRGRPTAGAG